MSQEVFINALGKFLPGEPIPNDAMEDYLGCVGGKSSRLKARILKQNGIKTRHYAIERDGTICYWNYEMASAAVRDALKNSELDDNTVQFLATATSQSDLLAPGFASLVHGELKLPPCEIASFHGICSSGMMALQSAFQGILSGQRANSVVCASEFTSRFFRKGFFEATDAWQKDGRTLFDAEFLRWMLSDGAGACVLENRPNARGLSLKIEWIDLVSYADRHDVCMYAGANKGADGKLEKAWYHYPNFAAAEKDGVMLLKQDVRLLEDVVKLGVNRYFALWDAGKFKPTEIDWMVCHYSSHVFRGMIFELLEKGGGMIPAERWFTNLYAKGNTGAASVFIMLEELFNEGQLKAGQKVLCMVPESGRFIISYMLLTIVGEKNEAGFSAPPAEEAALTDRPDELKSKLIRQLAQVWLDFAGKLNQVPFIDKMNRGKLRVEDYQALLLNLRQQVVDGARWISRAASNIDYEQFNLRSGFIGHAQDEHRDFQMLERDYVSVGGKLEDIQNAPKNIGSEAFSAWMFHRASQPNPFDLLGAMFIIEGLGQRLARKWGQQIREQLKFSPAQVSFLLYHGANDENHLQKLEQAFSSGILTETVTAQIVKTAKVTARLYLLQLEELGNF